MGNKEKKENPMKIVYPKGYTKFNKVYGNSRRSPAMKTVHRRILVQSIEDCLNEGRELNELQRSYYNPETGEWSEKFYDRYYRKVKTFETA